MPSTQPQGYEILVNDFDSDKLSEILDLFEEVLLNATLNKSMVASLFNERTKRLGGQRVKPDLFESGILSTTPPYLAEHERMVLNRVNKSRQERAGGDEGGDN